MVDRDKVLSVLHKRFPEAPRQQIAWAANAIVGLGDEWEVVAWNQPEIDRSDSVSNGQPWDRRDQVLDGTEFRIFQRRPVDVGS